MFVLKHLIKQYMNSFSLFLKAFHNDHWPQKILIPDKHSEACFKAGLGVTLFSSSSGYKNSVSLSMVMSLIFASSDISYVQMTLEYILNKSMYQ